MLLPFLFSPTLRATSDMAEAVVSHQSEEGRYVESQVSSPSNPDPRSLGTFTTEPKPSLESSEQGEERVAVATGVPGLQS